MTEYSCQGISCTLSCGTECATGSAPTGYAAAADFVDDAMSGVAEHPVVDEVVSLGQRLDPNRLRSLDAIHVASAMLLDADLLITYDDRMADAGQRNGLRCAAPGR